MGVLTDEMKRLVREQRLGFVATVCPDGTPNLSPKGTTTVWDDDHLVFADIRSPGTVRNLRRNPAVEINVVDPIARRGFRFKGAGRVIEDGPLLGEILSMYRAERGLDSARVRSVVLVKVERAEALTSPVYDLGRTEEEVRESWRRYYAGLWGLSDP